MTFHDIFHEFFINKFIKSKHRFQFNKNIGQDIITKNSVISKNEEITYEKVVNYIIREYHWAVYENCMEYNCEQFKDLTKLLTYIITKTIDELPLLKKYEIFHEKQCYYYNFQNKILTFQNLTLLIFKDIQKCEGKRYIQHIKRLPPF